MSKPFTKWQLFDAFVNRKSVNLAQFTGLIYAIELEDGSGHCFNVRMQTTFCGIQTVFVRTID
jgi:hypothetical protein